MIAFASGKCGNQGSPAFNKLSWLQQKGMQSCVHAQTLQDQTRLLSTWDTDTSVWEQEDPWNSISCRNKIALHFYTRQDSAGLQRIGMCAAPASRQRLLLNPRHCMAHVGCHCMTDGERNCDLHAKSVQVYAGGR